MIGLADYLIFQKINSFAGENIYLDFFGIFFAKYFGYLLVALLLLFLVKNSKKYWPMVIEGLTAAVIARYGIVELIRFLWERPRPFVENHVQLLIDKIDQAAFPSGHAAFFFALSIVIYFYNKKTGLLFFLASFLIAIARVFCGVHWPLDVTAGALVGIFSGWFIFILSRKFFSIEE